MQAGTLRSTVITRFTATTAPSDSCPPACAGTGLPSSRAELSERAMSLYPVPSGAAQNESAASVLVSATMTRLTTGDLSVRSFEAYIRDFTFVWLIPLSSWASARRSPFAQPTFLSACRFLCRTDSLAHHSVSSAELCLAHHLFPPCFWINEFSNVAFLASTVQRHCVFSICVTSRRGRCLERATVDNMVLRNFIRYGNFKAGTDGRVHLDPHGCAVVGPK